MPTGKALAKASLFAQLGQKDLDSFARAARHRNFRLDEVLVTEGDVATSFWVLTRGEAEVLKDMGKAGERGIGRLRAGDYFGEMALLDGFPRSASVRALTHCECAVLERADFDKLVRNNPDVALQLMAALSRRLRACENAVLP